MKDRVIALGFFDGVHLGHAALLREAGRQAARLGCSAAALTFDRHPSGLVTGQPVPLINTPEDREYLMRSGFGTDEILVLPFDRAMMELHWEDFLRGCLLPLRPRHVVCGQDYRFGFRGRGDAALLAAFCGENGVGCTVVDEVLADGVPVHSTGIRALLGEGRMEEAARLLGHPHCLSGRVAAGRQLGRTIGVPTANLPLPEGVLTLPHGVYAARAETGGRRYSAVVNIGSCPTVVQDAPPLAEAWLLGFSGDLYGQTLRLFFYRRLRGEEKFPSLAALREAILRDAAETERYFAEGKDLF